MQRAYSATRIGTAATVALVMLLTAWAPTARAVDYVAYTVAAEQNLPRVCLGFSVALGRAQPGDLSPYVRVEPAADVALASRGSDLCLTGLAHGADYLITLKAGLPAADGTRLAADVPVSLRIPDRQPRLAFRSKGYVLPLHGQGGIPLTSVNVERAALRVLRIGERNLVQQLADGMLGAQLDLWARERIDAQSGQQLFQGAVELASERNREVETALPVAELVGPLQAGLYIAVAEPVGAAPEDWDARATQWFTVSDLGITTFSGDAGLTAIVRSLASAEPVAGATLTLLARNNEKLGVLSTDAAGRASFDAGLLRGSGGDAARALVAEAGAGDLTFVDLGGPQLDLADRGLEGRTPPGALDAFVYTDRGIYRPGETVHVTVLLRDDQARAVSGLPLSVRLLRPDMEETERVVLRPDRQGGDSLSIPLAVGAFTGQWTLRVAAGERSAAIGEAAFLVEDFVPPRLEVGLRTDSRRATAEQPLPLEIDARWLYGAPASQLDGEAEMVVEAAPDPFPGLPGYRFGLVQEPFASERAGPVPFRTDVEGRASVMLALDRAIDATQPLQAVLRARVFDVDGRPVAGEIAVPMTASPWFVGIRPEFDGSAAENGEAGFALVAVAPDGTSRGGARLGWELVREQVDYVWFQRYGQWDYEVVVTDERQDAGEIVLADGHGRLAVPVQSGRYRIELFDPASGVASSHRFTAGWWESAEISDRPDDVEVRLEPATASGSARAFVRPPFDARVLLVQADGAVRRIEERQIGREGAFVDLAGWQVGVGGSYLLATAFAPTGAVNPRLPARAVGAAWLPGALTERSLRLVIEAPPSARPGDRLEAVLRVTGARADAPAFVTLAAVDDGILQLTGFTAPDPVGFFLGKRRLGVELRDLYGRLIDPGGRRGRIVSGGDARMRLQLTGNDLVGRRSVALFSGPVRLGADGAAHIGFDLPDFNGRLKLMAVAWDDLAVGGAATTVAVRPPLVADLTLPRFLAPGDQARLRLRLTNLQAPAGDYSVGLTASGPLALTPATAAVTGLAVGATGEAVVELTAQGAVGPGAIELAVAGPDGFALSRRFELGVRADRPYVTRRQVAMLEPGQSLTLDAALAAGWLPGTAAMALTLSAAPALDVAGLAADLRRYPYACTEQIVSRATVGLLASALGLSSDPTGADDAAVQSALRRLSNLQAARGYFSAWSAMGPEDLWLSAYAADFLLEARDAGRPVAGARLDAALTWLAQAFARAEDGPTARAGAAYAAAVLARAERLDLSSLRYFAERSAGKLPSDLARAQLAGAFAALGDRPRAMALVGELGGERAGGADAPADFGTPLRDDAAVLAVAAGAALLPPDGLADRVLRLTQRLAAARWLSTQEQAWTLRAAAALAGSGGELHVAVDGVDRRATSGAVELVRRLTAAAAPLHVRNLGASPIYRSLALTGIPGEPPAAEAHGFALSRRLLTPEGAAVDPQAVRQNDQLVVLIEGRAVEPGPHRTLVVDLLPAGLEVENIRLAGTPSVERLGWLGELTTPVRLEQRDDRWVAALDLSEDRPAFRLAYFARAVTPGQFVLPGSQVEDMYRPELMARTDSGRLLIAPR
jgi:uncharacterized protein YfaS (alpha-2-macroglobulin family)